MGNTPLSQIWQYFSKVLSPSPPTFVLCLCSEAGGGSPTLLSNGTRSHELRAQAHKAATTADTDHKSQAVTCTSAHCLKIRVPTPLLGLDNVLEWFTELRKTFTSIYWFIKRMYSRTRISSQMKRCKRQVHTGSQCRSFSIPAGLKCTVLIVLNDDVFTNPKTLRTPTLGFLCRLHQTGISDH